MMKGQMLGLVAAMPLGRGTGPLAMALRAEAGKVQRHSSKVCSNPTQF